MRLFAYVVMTNHVHVIMQSAEGELSSLIRDFKKFTSKKILAEVKSNPIESRRGWLKLVFEYHSKFNKRTGEFQFWTHFNHAVEINQNHIFDNCIEYIHNNPVVAGWVENQEDYLYSSARNYSDRPALIEIDYV